MSDVETLDERLIALGATKIEASLLPHFITQVALATNQEPHDVGAHLMQAMATGTASAKNAEVLLGLAVPWAAAKAGDGNLSLFELVHEAAKAYLKVVSP